MKLRQFAALAISILLHLAAGALLFVLTLSAQLPAPTPKSIELIPVGVYGYEPARGGNSTPSHSEISEPQSSKAAPTAQPTPKVSKASEPLITSPESKAPAIAKKEKTKEETEQERLAAEQRKREQQEKAINSKIAGAFGKKNAAKEKSGQGSGSGANNSVGAGYSLSGRNIVGSGGYPVRPEGFTPLRGTAVVRIVVDAAGKVTEASIRLKGTNITNQTTLNAAIRAAKQTQFNASPGAPPQEGTITYHFDIQ